jgi:hypothetical protein
MFNFLVVMITPTALENIGYKMYIIFAIFNIWFAITVYFIYPETAGKTLEDIDLEFLRKYGGEEQLRAIQQGMEKKDLTGGDAKATASEIEKASV